MRIFVYIAGAMMFMCPGLFCCGGQSVWLDELANVDRIEHGAHGLVTPRVSTNYKERDKDGNRKYFPMTLGGQVYERGVGVHARSEIFVRLSGDVERFDAVVGLDDSVGERGAVVFEIWSDDRLLTSSERITGAGNGIPVSVALNDAKRLALIVDTTGTSIANCHFDWADAKFVMKDEAKTSPSLCFMDDVTTPVIVCDDGDEPRFHGPQVVGASPGKPFLFRVPATGNSPLTYRCEDLPDGLTLDAATGIISGCIVSEGLHLAHVVVTNNRGSAEREYAFVARPNRLALTPPMGWNSWNCFHWAINDKLVREMADCFETLGLAAHGYQYVVIDDVWQADKVRPTTGALCAAKQKFPDMKGLADALHDKGLKFGIYSSPGPTTCANFAGSYQHEQEDADQFAAWGIDYLKYDWCGYSKVVPNFSRGELIKPYKLMSDCLHSTSRDIVFSLCQYGMGSVWEWGRTEAGGNLWRTTGDIIDTWGCMSTIGFAQKDKAQWACPGGWNDPDMLTVGWVACTRKLHPSLLKPNEQLTHISLWSLLSAPLMIGCDLTKMDDFTRSLLTHSEVIDINQDVLGRQADRVDRDGFGEVWAKELSDGTIAVGLFNRDIVSRKVCADFAKLGRAGGVAEPVRDVWQCRDLGEFKDGITLDVPGHGVVLLKIGTPHKIPITESLKRSGMI
ncbi:MAG: NPCBM/NEW2 domain-containing protein [Candidatus Sumerlaeales bacterium]|nr:NPCBM/NEW2 domain-containing protein [Candidatus Sumerlaeales bacterium]